MLFYLLIALCALLFGYEVFQLVRQLRAKRRARIEARNSIDSDEKKGGK